jgi:hypothetical protein
VTSISPKSQPTLGFKQPAPEAKPDEETPEPNEAATDESTEPDPETDQAQDQNDEETTTEDDPEETAGEEPEPADEAAAAEKVAPDKVQKRIDRLTAEKHELREQLDAIKAELEATAATAAAKPPIVTMDPENPLSGYLRRQRPRGGDCQSAGGS